MKKYFCQYCGKTLGEGQDFCSASCREHYEQAAVRDTRRLPFFAVGMVPGFVLMLLGVFMSRPLLLGLGILIMGITVVVFPFCMPDTVRRLGYRRSCLVGRLSGIFLVLVGLWMVMTG